MEKICFFKKSLIIEYFFELANFHIKLKRTNYPIQNKMNPSFKPVFYLFFYHLKHFQFNLANLSIQTVFQKNFELLKVKFKSYASSSIDNTVINELIPKFQEFMIDSITSIDRMLKSKQFLFSFIINIHRDEDSPDLLFCITAIINTFLYKLSNYEILKQIPHHSFVYTIFDLI